MSENTTIGQVLHCLAPDERLEELCHWPPDAFAAAAYLLHKTGAYRAMVIERYWKNEQSTDWYGAIEKVAKEWEDTAADVRSPPSLIRDWWEIVLNARSRRLQDIYPDRILCRALLDLCAAADQACAGVGVPVPQQTDHAFIKAANYLLGMSFVNSSASSTLCMSINPWIVSVLPKLHTPQTGMTLRSLSHYLALCEVGEVSTQWTSVPYCLADDQSRHGMNLLLVPWPKKVTPLQFRAVSNSRCGHLRLPVEQGYFEYDHDPWDDQLLTEFEVLLSNAKAQVGVIDGVILPELSLPSTKIYERFASSVASICPKAFLVAGVHLVGEQPDQESENCVMYTMPMAEGYSISYKQNKHHRWRVDGAQVQQYGLGHRLDPSIAWWEHTDLTSRHLYFFSAASWLTFCFLVCEDLARLDPIATLLRSVGPNLVIALLMDGPQLKSRWPARYATVLADDPGSSVLTLTSIGMVLQSRRREEEKADQRLSRSIALWKDSRNATREIELDPDSGGVVLTLARRYDKEFTADGRNDGMLAASLILCDVIQVPNP